MTQRGRRVLWLALEHAHRSRAVSMRQHFILAGHLHISNRFWQDFCAPAVVMATIEELCREGRLSRQRATRIEEHLLHYVDWQGSWRGDPPGEERSTIHPPDVRHFAETGSI